MQADTLPRDGVQPRHTDLSDVLRVPKVHGYGIERGGCKCMADPSNDELEWETNAFASLRNLKLDDTPGLELLLIDGLARWCVSDSNPGRDYDEQHAAVAITALLSAVESASSYEGTVRPEATEEITIARTQVVAG